VQEIGNSYWDSSILSCPPAQQPKECRHPAQTGDNLHILTSTQTTRVRLDPVAGLISSAEYETLTDLVLGLTDRGISLRQHMSVRGVQNRISSLSHKLLKGADGYLKETAGLELYNTRVRIILEAIKLGLIDPGNIDCLDQALDQWLLERFRFDRSCLLEIRR